MKKLLATVLLLNLLNLSFAQEDTDSYSRWHIKPAAGFHFPFTKLLSNDLVDNLFEYDDNSYYWQILSASYFFDPNWGIDATFQGGSSHSITARADRFNHELEKIYGSDYFVSPSSGAQYSSGDPFILGSIQRGYLGLVYRIEKPNYIFLPKLSVGVTSFYTDWGSAYLKEKGTHQLYKLSYTSGRRPNNYLTFAPSITFGYRILKRVIANIDILYSYYKTDVVFEKELLNTFTDNITLIEYIDYEKDIHTLSIGAGLIVELPIQ